MYTNFKCIPSEFVQREHAELTLSTSIQIRIYDVTGVPEASYIPPSSH